MLFIEVACCSFYVVVVVSALIVTGGRDNAKMVTKGILQALSLPAKDGNYFLRPDRILGAFVLPASRPPLGRAEARAALALERAADVATKERLGSAQLVMSRFGDELREFNNDMRGLKVPEHTQGRSTGGGMFGGKGDGDIEMQECYPPDGFGHSYTTQPFQRRLLSAGSDNNLANSTVGSSAERSHNGTSQPHQRQTQGFEDQEHERRKGEHLLRQSMTFRAPQNNPDGSSNSQVGAPGGGLPNSPLAAGDSHVEQEGGDATPGCYL
jgi:hypothetical protein